MPLALSATSVAAARCDWHLQGLQKSVDVEKRVQPVAVCTNLRCVPLLLCVLPAACAACLP